MKYIPKLHIHQHSLLTRKVLFRHNFQYWSSSLYQLDHLIISISSLLSLQVIFIIKSSLSLSHLNLWIWIISQSGSSWDIITRSGSSLNLDHHHWIWIHSIWIITAGSSSLDLDHHCWTIITGSGSSLDLDHQWCYHMILLVTGISTELSLFHVGCRHSPHVGLLQHLYLTYSSERHSTHIHPCWNTSCSQWWKSFVLPSRLEPHPLTMMKELCSFHPS